MNNKRILSALLAFLMVFSLLPSRVFSASIANGDCGDALQWGLSEDGTLTISGSGTMNNFGEAAKQPWRAYCDAITAVYIEDGVTTIGSSAFSGLEALTSVRIPATVTDIEKYAFSGCISLQEVAIPEGVITLRQNAFGGCSSLEKLYLPQSLTDLYGGQFSNCPKLITAGPVGSGCNIEFGWTTEIPRSAFNMTVSLESVILPNGLTSIGNSAFAYTYSLKSVAIPYTLNFMDNKVFQGSAVTEVYFNNTDTSIKFWLNNVSLGSTTMYYPKTSTWWTSVLKSDSNAQAYDFYCTSMNGGKHFDVVVDSKESTCTEKGYIDYHCYMCAYDHREYLELKPHTGGEVVTENYVAEKCVENGSYDTVVYCTVCGQEVSRETVVIPAHGHREKAPVEENRVEPKCVEKGAYDTVVYCDICGNELSRIPHTIDALGHVEGEAVQENYTDPTCTEVGGYDMVVYCTVCGDELNRTHHSIDAIGHDWDEGKITTDPTCTDKGVKTYTCKHDSKHTYTEPVDAKGHTEGVAVEENAAAPTCTEVGGYDMVVYCTVCKAELSRTHSVIDALGHTAGEAVKENDVSPTCTEDGGYDMVVYCNVCNEELSRTSHTVEAVGHTAVTDEAVAPTCTETGLTEGSHCSVCDEVLVARESVDALGHDYSYTNNGEGTHTADCGRCDSRFVEEHTFVNGACFCGGKELTTDDSIVIYHTLDLASDISINFVVPMSALEGYDSYYMECQIPVYEGNKLTGYSVVRIEPVANASYYYFSLPGMTAVRMGDMVDATLHMTRGSAKYISATDTFSVSTYAYNMLNTSSDVKMLTLCADLLRYGAEAQSFKGYRTDALVDAAMTEEQRGYLSDTAALSFTSADSYLGDLESPAITWVGKTLDLASKVGTKFVFDVANYTGDLAALTMKVTYQNNKGVINTVTLSGAEAYNASRGYYAFTFYGLLAAELRAVVEVAVFEGETQRSETLRYSAESYAARNATGELAPLCKALFAYSDSAKAFFAK